jgi:hypothetical protein
MLFSPSGALTIFLINIENRGVWHLAGRRKAIPIERKYHEHWNR